MPDVDGAFRGGEMHNVVVATVCFADEMRMTRPLGIAMTMGATDPVDHVVYFDVRTWIDRVAVAGVRLQVLTTATGSVNVIAIRQSKDQIVG